MIYLRLFFMQTFFISISFLSGCSNESTPDEEMLVSFAMNKTNSRVEEIISFTNTSEYGISYDWDFGDGNSSTEENPDHSYSSIGEFNITLTAHGNEGSRKETKSIIIWDIIIESTFYGDKVEFEGPGFLKSQYVKIIFSNQSSGLAAANLVKHDKGYSHKDMRDIFDNGISYSHHPDWTTEVFGVWEEIDTNKSHTWIGNLEPGLYTLVNASSDPFSVWYVAGLTVQN